jgi:long-chain acyl-CoA synthetase
LIDIIFFFSETRFQDLIGKEYEEVCADQRVVSALLKELHGHGRRAGLQKFELPGAITLIPEQWTLESGLVTAAFKLKRKPIEDYYQKELKKMYESKPSE